MSVINQMLKDLEQRTPEQGQASIPVAINHKPSTIKIVLISLLVLISLNLLGFYIWDLQAQIASSKLKINEKVKKTVANVEQTQQQQSAEKLLSTQEDLDRKVPIPENISLTENKAEFVIEPPRQSMVKKQVSLPESSSKNTVATKVLAQPKSTSENIVVLKPQIQQESPKPQYTRAVPDNTPIESKMSVSRRQLTPEELVTQKLVRAEKAIKIKDIIKAEQLFEEVLIIEPNHKQTRKKLAALWFGRKSYQQATNLLSQGISLDRNDAELRLLKARIHLQQGQHQAAYNTLKPLPTHKQQEYQVMLANVSQQVEQYKSAIQAYKVLIDMQAYSGRWHLGLAIVYDKNSQFSLAVAEYTLALTKSDLSLASAKFAQQRMQALGE